MAVPESAQARTRSTSRAIATCTDAGIWRCALDGRKGPLTAIAFALALLGATCVDSAWSAPGDGGGNGGASSNGGSTISGPGGIGGASGGAGTGSGGGAGGGFSQAIPSTTSIGGFFDGGAGGSGGGGFASVAASGGGGGAAVYVTTGGVSLESSAILTGGAGGQGGNNTTAGGGGGGGAGVFFAGSGTLVNTGTITGGAGGTGGSGTGAGGGGGGGHGVVGGDIVIQNSGTISGGAGGAPGSGFNRAGGTAGAAVKFTSGANQLLMEAGSVIGGAVWIASSASATLKANAAGLTLGGALILDGAGTIETPNDMTLNGSVSGAGAMIKTGAGTLVLNGTNTSTGLTTVSAGTLQVGNGGATGTLGTGAVVNNGTLAFNRNNAATVGNDISGSGAVTFNGSGTVTLTGSNTYAGTTMISAGGLQVGNGGGTGTLGTGAVVNNGTLAFNRNNAMTVGNDISGSGAVAVNGSGTVTLTGANSYAGTTTIGAGALQVGNAGGTGTLGTGAVVNNGTLAFNRNDAVTVANAIAGTGSVRQAGSGTTTLTGVNSYAGGTRIESGVLAIDGDTRLGLGTGGVTLAGGTLRATANILGGRALTLEGAGGTLDVNGQLVGMASANGASGVLTVGSTAGGGTLALFAAGNFSGGTTIRDGVSVNMTASGALGSGDVALQGLGSKLVFIAGANAGANRYTVGTAGTADAGNRITLSGSGSAQMAQFTVNGTDWRTVNGPTNSLDFINSATAGMSKIDARGGTVSFTETANAGSASIVAGDRALVQFLRTSSAGQSTLTNQSGGTLRFADQSTADKAAIENQAGATLDVSGMNGAPLTIGALSGAGRVALGATQLALGASNGSETIGGAIGDAGSEFAPPNSGTGGSIAKVGSGTLTLSGLNTYTGATLVAQGALRAGVANTLSAASAFTVSKGAMLDLAGHDQTVKSLSNSGTVSLVGSTPGAQLVVNGNYTGNSGVLRVGTALTATGPSDQLVINGGKASGKTTIEVTQLGGLGAYTTGNGIEVIAARNGATTTAQTSRDAFALAGGHVDAGAFEYRLYAADAGGAGESWYLRTQSPPTPPAPRPPPSATAPTPTPTPAPAPVPTYRAEAPLLAAAPAQFQGMDMAMLGSARTRYGDNDARSRQTAGLTPVPGELSVDRRAWARAIYSDIDVRQAGTVSPSATGHVSGAQAGADLYVSDMGLWRAGVFVGNLRGSASISGFASGTMRQVGTSDLSARYLGAYATYTGPGGWYFDGTLQFGRQTYTSISNNGLAIHGKGDSTAAGVEVGRSFAIGDSRWVLEPQAQLNVRRAHLDDVVILGARVIQGDETSWTASVGARIKGDFATSAGRLQPYARASVVHGRGGEQRTGFAGPAGFTDLISRSNYTSAELAGGATLSLTRTLSLYGEVGSMFSLSGEMKVKSSIQGALGVRAVW